MAAEQINEEGFFCATVPGAERDVRYRLRIVKPDGSEELHADAYQYGPIMGDVDLHLFAEGQHWELYAKFGAHLRAIGDVTGVYFAVWAPNAQRVSVVGEFNAWDGRRQSDAQAARLRRVGDFPARRGRRRALQIRGRKPHGGVS